MLVSSKSTIGFVNLFFYIAASILQALAHLSISYRKQLMPKRHRLVGPILVSYNCCSSLCIRPTSVLHFKLSWQLPRPESLELWDPLISLFVLLPQYNSFLYSFMTYLTPSHGFPTLTIQHYISHSQNHGNHGRALRYSYSQR